MTRRFALPLGRPFVVPSLAVTLAFVACSTESADDSSLDGPAAAGGTAGESSGTGGAGGCTDCEEDGCTASSCSGHGLCTEEEIGTTCACDVGFEGDECERTREDFYARRLLVEGLADPDVYEENDDSFFLTGTNPDGRTLTFHHSTDWVTFDEYAVYDPSAVDPDHEYCHVKAPDLTHYDGAYDLYFSAYRVARGEACPPPSGRAITTFHVSTPSRELEFGVPELVIHGTNLPGSRIEDGCHSSGCEKTIRIDAAAYDDGIERWFFYVWFDAGNNVASYRFSDPASLVLNAGPAVFTTPPSEESINEAPDVFSRNGKYYLFFSGGAVDGRYAMYYVMADDVASLTRARTVRRHSTHISDSSGRFVESHGHNSVVERRGEFFNVFHQGEFDAEGTSSGRSTWVQRMAFAADDSILSLNYVDLRWSHVPDASYSLDLVTRDGETIGPCLGAGRLGTSTSARFGGICLSQGNRLVRKSDIATFRLYDSTDGTWGRHVDVPYDGKSDRVFFPLDGGTTDAIALRWTELENGRNYSFDVRRDDGSWVAPCVGVGTLGSSTEYTFDGNCVASEEIVSPSEIQAIRVCSAVGSDWANARCGTTVHDGSPAFVDVNIP